MMFIDCFITETNKTMKAVVIYSSSGLADSSVSKNVSSDSSLVMINKYNL